MDCMAETPCRGLFKRQSGLCTGRANLHHRTASTAFVGLRRSEARSTHSPLLSVSTNKGGCCYEETDSIAVAWLVCLFNQPYSFIGRRVTGCSSQRVLTHSAGKQPCRDDDSRPRTCLVQPLGP